MQRYLHTREVIFRQITPVTAGGDPIEGKITTFFFWNQIFNTPTRRIAAKER